MKITKKLFLALFTMVASLLLVGNANAATDGYEITIDSAGNLKLGEQDTCTAGTSCSIDDGKIVYDSETNTMTIGEGVVVKTIRSARNLTITTNGKTAYVNYVNLQADTTSEKLTLIIDNASIKYDEELGAAVKEYYGDHVLIKDSNLDLGPIVIAPYGDMFVENSTVKTTSLITRGGALKMTDSTFEGQALTSTLVFGERHPSEDTLTWKDPDKYVFGGYNGRAFYSVLILDSDVTLTGESQGSISSYRGILIDNSTVNDKSTLNQFIQNSIDCDGVSGADVTDPHREITINDSKLNLKGKIGAADDIDIAITNSDVIIESSLYTHGGNLTLTDSKVVTKNYTDSSDETRNESPILVDGNLTITNSLVTADASGTDGKVAAIAYTGTFTIDDKSVALNKGNEELVKDIDITGITYNSLQVDDDDKVYTLGTKGVDGAINDHITIGTPAKITIKIENGTWEDGTTEPIVITKLVGQELTKEDLPTGMKSTNGSTTGNWNKELPLTLSADTELTYVFEIENPDTGDNAITFIALGLVAVISLVTVVSLRKRFQ